MRRMGERPGASACLGQGGTEPTASAERAEKEDTAAAASGWLRGAGWAERPKAREERERRFSISSFSFLFQYFKYIFKWFLKSFPSRNKNQSSQIKTCSSVYAQTCI
jgi:hypothetical protein